MAREMTDGVYRRDPGAPCTADDDVDNDHSCFVIILQDISSPNTVARQRCWNDF